MNTPPRAAKGKARCSIYLTSEVLADIQCQATRLHRPMSWVIRKAWLTAREHISRLPEPETGV